MAKKTLHILHASMKYSDTLAEKREDFRFHFSKDPDIISYTETHEQPTKALLREMCQNNGYRLATWDRGDNSLAVKIGGDAHGKLKSMGGVVASDGLDGFNPNHPALYTKKFIRWVRYRWYDEDIWMHNAHWIFTPRVWEQHGQTAEVHTEMTRAMCAQVKKHGRNASLSFFGGDINIDEGVDNRTDHPNMPNEIFRENGLLTIWDEFHVVPKPTIHNSVYDIIGSYRPDTRVTGLRYKVWPKQHSDHHPISAWYEVKLRDATTTGGGGGDPKVDEPTPGDKGGEDSPYATGGNVSWADYMDTDTYPLPTARDDSQFGGE